MQFAADLLKIDEDKRRVFGWAYVAQDSDGETLIDKQGDFIDDPEELEKAAYTFTIDSRRGDAMHFKKGVAQLIESFVVTPEKIEKMGITGTPRLAWWIGMEVKDDETWDLIKSGQLRAFSIGGKGKREVIDAASS